MTRIALSAWHSIVDHDDLAMLHSLGHEAVNLGAYLNPRHPDDPKGEREGQPRNAKRPPLDIDPPPPEVLEACADTHVAKGHYPDVLLDWLGKDGVLIVHHFVEAGIFNQWPRLKAWGGRVIWRSCGQSHSELEHAAAYYRSQGMERVAYSPREQFIPGYAGHDALIRFAVDPAEYGEWTGDLSAVINVTQDMAKRAKATNLGYWQQVTADLPHHALGPGSEEIGGEGELTFDELKSWLRSARAYLYTGTQPAPYTLGLLEAGMTGIPIVSIGPIWMTATPYGPELFEGHALVPAGGYDEPQSAKAVLGRLLDDHDYAKAVSRRQRAFYEATFGLGVIAEQWRDYLR